MFKVMCSPDIHRSSLAIITEILKISISLFAFVKTAQQWRTIWNDWSLQASLSTAGLPACLYACQSLLNQYAMAGLDPVMFNMLNQSKLLTNALFVYLILGKPQTTRQIYALCVLALAGVVLSWPSESTELASGSGIDSSTSSTSSTSSISIDIGHNAASTSSSTLPAMYALAATTISGFAGSLCQRALQGKDNVDPFMFSAELSMWSLVTLLIGSMLFDIDGVRYLYTVPLPAYLPMIFQAVGGIIISQVTKHVGTVRKSFGLIAGILVAGVIEYVIFNTAPPFRCLAASPLVAVAIWAHVQFQSKSGVSSENSKQKRNSIKPDLDP